MLPPEQEKEVSAWEKPPRPLSGGRGTARTAKEPERQIAEESGTSAENAEKPAAEKAGITAAESGKKTAEGAAKRPSAASFKKSAEKAQKPEADDERGEEAER